ncbi:WhiB family transcriptional regulator [Nocardiopsis ansamitocini]|nr:WhiB family transcriptional regulator [Nocardiopsis ansamitocini]
MTNRQLGDVLLATTRPCASSPELFFATDDETESARRMREQAASVLCAECPARRLCFEYATRTEPEHGFWAGCTAEEIRMFNQLGEVA